MIGKAARTTVPAVAGMPAAIPLDGSKNDTEEQQNLAENQLYRRDAGIAHEIVEDDTLTGVEGVFEKKFGHHPWNIDAAGFLAVSGRHGNVFDNGAYQSELEQNVGFEKKALG